MNQILSRQQMHDRRHEQLDARQSAARQQHQATVRQSETPIVNRFCPEWFALRIWEDDGGGYAA
jgi:hypothetical protein